MIGLEVEGFAVTIDCAGVTAGVAHEAEQIMRLGRHPALPQMGFANLRSLVQVSGIGEAARGFKLGLGGGRWSACVQRLQSAARKGAWL